MKCTLIIIGVIILVLFALALGTLITMWIWNAFAAYFGFKPIGFWIAFLITVVWGSITSSFQKK